MKHNYWRFFKDVLSSLNTVMGKDLSEHQAKQFRTLLGWNDNDKIDFKTFCGICALCERMLAAEYCPHMLGKKADPCHEVTNLLNILKIISVVFVFFYCRLRLQISNR